MAMQQKYTRYPPLSTLQSSEAHTNRNGLKTIWDHFSEIDAWPQSGRALVTEAELRIVKDLTDYHLSADPQSNLLPNRGQTETA